MVGSTTIASIRDAFETASPEDEAEELLPAVIKGAVGAGIVEGTEVRGTLLIGTTASSQLGAFLLGAMVRLVHGPNGRPPST